MAVKHDILSVLQEVRDGTLSPEDALLRLKLAPFEDLGYAKVDYHRAVRQGVPEVIYGQSKTTEQIRGILESMRRRGCVNILVTRIGPDVAEALKEQFPLRYEPLARLHRLLSNLEPLMSARAVVAVAGMEGALASVVGGLVDCPVIAVPTSVGYGASLGGLSALLSMLNSCASGTSVVNIDNGFGAGFLASRINQMESAES